jgi:hypothetical protein
MFWSCGDRPLFHPFYAMMNRSWLGFCICLFAISACDDEGPSSGVEGAGMSNEMGAGNDGGTEIVGGMSLAGEEAMASCMADEDCPAGTLCDSNEQACRSACDRDQECGSSEACLSNFCTALETCDGGVGGTCSEGDICDCNGLCIPLIGNPCQNDLQCQVSEYCDPCKGQCQARVKPCQPCVNSVSCERGGDLCAPVGERGEQACLRACVGQGTCDNLGPGYLCQAVDSQGDFCVPEAGECTQLTECMRDADCEASLFCNDRFQCQPGCIDDTSCSDGLICQGLRCAPLCTSDEVCLAEGAVCDEDGRCQIPGGCQSSRDCLEAETYCNLDTFRCVSGCQIDDDCLDASQECVAGRCRPRGCSRNYQCSFGQVCDLESNMCVMAEGRHCEANCDPMDSEMSCGTEGQRCLSLQDEEENPIGDFCFEPCQEEPNPCPQGYSCETIEDPNAGELKLCIRRCDISPVMP